MSVFVFVLILMLMFPSQFRVPLLILQSIRAQTLFPILIKSVMLHCQLFHFLHRKQANPSHPSQTPACPSIVHLRDPALLVIRIVVHVVRGHIPVRKISQQSATHLVVPIECQAKVCANVHNPCKY